MDLFHFQEEAPGSVFWHPKGWTLFQTLIAYMRRRPERGRLPRGQLSRHDGEALLGALRPLGELPRDMFTTVLPDERVFCCKPMNCPGHVQIFKHGLRAIATCPEDRRVRQGAPLRAVGRAARAAARAPLHAGRRAHLHHRRPDRGASASKINDLMLSIYEDFGFEDIVVKLSTRPEKRVGADELWDQAEADHGRCAEARSRQSRQGSIKTRSIRARAPSTGRSSSTC